MKKVTVRQHATHARRATRSLRVLAVSLLAAVVLVGCAGIPSSGPVQTGQDVASEVNPEFEFLARSPQPGATQSEILLGFIDAAASPHDRYAVAQQYLSPSFASEWLPDSNTLIDSGALRNPVTVSATAMSLTVTALADVSESGEYAQRDAPTMQVLGYEFVQVDNEWRISKAPQGILVDSGTFSLVFGSYPLYFFDPTFSYLVPDLRWFPRRTSTPTFVVRALLEGPSEWLIGAVRSAFPEGTALAADTVQVVARTAQVDLTPSALQTDAISLQRMRLQLRESLSSVSSGLGVTITVDQIEQQISDMLTKPISDPHVDPRALVLRDKEFGYLAASGNNVSPLDISEQVVALAPNAVSVGIRQGSGHTAAVLNPQGVWAVRPGSDARLFDDRPGLIAPVIDVFGYIWSIPANAPNDLRAYAPDGTATQVPTSWPDASSIVSLELSRDGTRVIALYRTGEITRLVASAIQRGDGEARNAPQQLGIPLVLAAPATADPIGTAWVNELTVLAVTHGSGDETVVTSQQIGGPSVAFEGAPGAIAVSGGNSNRELRLLTDEGVLMQRRGLSWQPRIDGVSVLGVPLGL